MKRERIDVLSENVSLRLSFHFVFLTLLGTKWMQCWSSEHVRYLIPSYISMIVYVIGIPVSAKIEAVMRHQAPTSLRCITVCMCNTTHRLQYLEW